MNETPPPAETWIDRFRGYLRLLARMCQALERLPEAQRIAIERQYFDGQSLEQIGQHLSRSVPAVAGLLRRGLRSLKMTLAENE